MHTTRDVSAGDVSTGNVGKSTGNVGKGLAVMVLVLLLDPVAAMGQEPPAINPFGRRPQVREDAIPGMIELSDGTVYAGRIYLTRDVRLKIYDEQLERQREVPLRVVSRIDCKVKRQWMEKEWRFRENANAQKVYTGRTYPARECVHTITLHDGRKIEGPLAAVVYIQPEGSSRPRKFLLHKRQKGEIGSDLDSLVYVRSIRLGDEAYQEALQRITSQQGSQ